MHNSKNRKSKRILILLLILMPLSLINFNSLRWNSNNSKNNNNNEEFDEFDLLDEHPRLSSYSSSFNGTGENISMTLHQSYLDTSFNTPLNTSDSNNNKFTVPCPKDTTFNSSYTNFTIEDIIAPNKSFVIEDDYSWQFSLGSRRWTSFEVKGHGFLENVSIKIINDGGDEDYDIRLYNAQKHTYLTIDYIKPLSSIATLASSKNVPQTSGSIWLNLTNVHERLNISETYNNTFFIAVLRLNDYGEWEFENQGDGDDTISWDSLSDDTPQNKDYMLKIGVAPLNNTPNPEDVGLRINNKKVNGYSNINGSGYWESFDVISNSTGVLTYVISAEWWDVTCNIAQVQINYTKTNLDAISEFNITTGSAEFVNWTVSTGELDDFNSTFSHYWINFTVPATWSNFRAFNGTSAQELSDNTTLGSPIGNYMEYQIYNASNGPNWYITANSTNLLNEINIFVDSVKYYNYTVNFDKTIDIIGNFSEIIKDGNATIEIYSPDSTGNCVNHTNYNDTITPPTKEVYLGNWTLKDNVTDYGVFITRMGWNNGTAAGFFIGNLTILGISDLIPSLPDDIFYANEIFNITVAFNDTGQNKGITDGNISYSIMGNTFTTENVTDLQDGNYTITIDCNDTGFGGYGLKSVEIHANQTFFNNQSKTVQFTIWGNTTLNYYNFYNNSLYDSSEHFNITVEFYDEIKEEGIDGDYINYSLDGGLTYRNDKIEMLGDGRYNITVNCSDTNFADYGPQIIIVNVTRSYYENQSIILGITITGDTELILTKWPDQSFYYSDEILNITAHFNDTSRNQGIDGANVQIYVKNATSGLYDLYSTNIIPEGNGDYNITINCSDAIFNRYGWFDLKINASKQNYHNASNSSLDLIIGNTTLTLIDPLENSVYVKGEIFNVTVQFYDVVKEEGILGAIINYTIDGSNYRGDNVTEIGNGRYIITIYANDSDFGDDYGFRTLEINASKQHYNNLTYPFTFHRQMTTMISPSNTANLGSVIRGINVSYSFNYSETDGDPIKEVSWELISDSYNLIPFLENEGNGNYTMHLDTSNVNVPDSPFTYIFNISAIGNETQIISLDFEVTIIQTQVENIDGIDIIARNSGLNQTLTFYFKDDTNELPVLGLTTSDVIVKNYGTETIWDTGDFNWKLIDVGGGNYRLNISLGTGMANRIDSGLYTLELNVSKDPNYNWSLEYYSFYLRGNYTQINMISVSDYEQVLVSSSMGYNYTTFLGSDLFIEFNITDNEFNNRTVIGDADGYVITFKNLGTGLTGTLQETLYFDLITGDYGIHLGSIISSELTNAGNYLINITVVKLNYENTTFSFNLTLINSQINIMEISNPGGQLEPSGIGNYYSSSVALDISLEFNITDTEALGRIIARDATSYIVRYTNLGTSATGIIQNTFTFNSPTSSYLGTLLISDLSVGNYLINISVEILNYVITPLIFNLTIVYADSNILSITNPGGEVSPSIIDNFYETFIGSNITVEFNILDAKFGIVIQIGTSISYIIFYQNIDTSETGVLQHDITESTSSHSGSLNISQLTAANYTIFIVVQKSGNTVSTLDFKLRVIEKYIVRITVQDSPNEVTAGKFFNITILAEYDNGTDWLPLIGENIIVIPYFDGIAQSIVNPLDTNSSGIYIFKIPTSTDATNISLMVEIPPKYNHLGDTLEISGIILNQPPSGLMFEDLLPFIMIIGAAIAVAGASLGVYRGVVVPKKREKARVLTEVKTIFDDAINLEHVLVLHKGTGTCIYFKSFGSEAIDPELISGFISAISSFGKDLVSQEVLNEISYGDKMLLLSDGEFIRIALVLSKKASIILRKNLKELINIFEKTFADELPKWRGQLNIFRNAEILIDEALNTSIILPHEITYEFSNIKELKISHSREVLRLANSLVEDSERKFFFIATLLKEASEKSSKDTAEVFMGIKELRDKKILMPIEISAIETPPISQQEINLINQKLDPLIDLSPEEKQKLVNDLAQMGPAEREAYFVSLKEQHEIISAPIEAKPGATIIENIKDAKKEISKLKKIAKKENNKKNYENAIKIYQDAAQIALNWELSREFNLLDDTVRMIKIEDLKIKLKDLENEAKIAAKEEKYNEATQKYRMSSKIASEIFKLGVDEMTKEVKRLTNKSKEYEKLV